MSKWTNEKLKTSNLDGPSDQIQKLIKLHFCYDSKNLGEITHFNINTGLKFPNLAEICRENAFLCNFHKIFKGLSFDCRKFLDLKSLGKVRKLWKLLILPSKHSPWWRRVEDVMKTSFVFVFGRRLDQDEYVRLSHTSSRRLQDIFKTFSRRLAKMSSRRFQDVLQNVLKTSSRIVKTFSRRIINLKCSW